MCVFNLKDKRDRMRDLLSIGLFPQHPQNQGWARLKLGAKNVFQVSYVGIRDSSTGAITCCLSTCVSRELEVEAELGLVPRHCAMRCRCPKPHINQKSKHPMQASMKGFITIYLCVIKWIGAYYKKMKKWKNHCCYIILCTCVCVLALFLSCFCRSIP